MKTSDFSFDLPEELIAQTLIHSRLMVLISAPARLSTGIFTISWVTPRTVSSSMTLPARIYGGEGGDRRPCGIPPAAKQGRRLGGPGRPGCGPRRAAFPSGTAAHCEVIDVLLTKLIHFEYEGCSSTSWIRSAKCPFRLTSRRSWWTKNAIRPSTPEKKAPRPLPRQGCTSPRSCWRRSGKRGWSWALSPFMWGWAPSGQ